MRALPKNVAVALGRGMGATAYHALGELRRTGLRNLELAFPEKSLAERKAILQRVFRNLGRVMAFTSQFDKLTLDDLKEMVTYEPDPNFKAKLEQAEELRRGRIVLGGHFGNWELQAFSFPAIFGPLSFLSRQMDNPLIDARVKRTRERLGNKQIEKGSSPAAILRVLRHGGSVGILSDVNSQAKEGVFVPFFGRLACTATGVATLAIRANAIIVPMWALWDEHEGKYRLVYEDIIDPADTAGATNQVEKTTAQCVAALEAAIRKYPDQWIWVHKRWKTRPPGEAPLY